jgi:hypothetical protein
MCNRLHHYVPLVEMVKKNIYGTSNLGSGWESYASEKMYELPVLPVRDHRYYRWMVVGGVVWHENELPVLPVDPDRKYR